MKCAVTTLYTLRSYTAIKILVACGKMCSNLKQIMKLRTWFETKKMLSLLNYRQSIEQRRKAAKSDHVTIVDRHTNRLNYP